MTYSEIVQELYTMVEGLPKEINNSDDGRKAKKYNAALNAALQNLSASIKAENRSANGAAT